MVPISKEAFLEWRESPVTKEILARIEAQRQYLLQALENGSTLADDPGLTAQLTARMIGELAGINYLTNTEFYNEDV